MGAGLLDVEEVVALGQGRIGIIVHPPDGVDLQHIYRAGKCVYWNPTARRFEDRGAHEESQAASFLRIADAVLSEYGLRLRLHSATRWVRVASHAREEMQIGLT